MSIPSFEIIPTTADIGFNAWAGDLTQLFAQAAIALFSIISNPNKIISQKSVSIKIKASDWYNGGIYGNSI